MSDYTVRDYPRLCTSAFARRTGGLWRHLRRSGLHEDMRQEAEVAAIEAQALGLDIKQTYAHAQRRCWQALVRMGYYMPIVHGRRRDWTPRAVQLPLGDERLR